MRKHPANPTKQRDKPMTDFNAFDDLDLDCTTESDLTPEQQAEIDAVWDTLTEDDQ